MSAPLRSRYANEHRTGSVRARTANLSPRSNPLSGFPVSLRVATADDECWLAATGLDTDSHQGKTTAMADQPNEVAVVAQTTPRAYDPASQSQHGDRTIS
jgi:hypothetical protein